MTNQVTYTIMLTPENAPKIDAINNILLGTDYTSVDAKAVETEIEQKATKYSAQDKAYEAIKADEQKVAQQAKAEQEAEQEAEGSEVTFDDVKKAAKKAKADHGEEFVMEVLKAAGVKVAPTLRRSVSNIDKDMYEEIISAWKEGFKLTDQASDEPEDYGLDNEYFDDEEDTSEVTAEAVKTALRAYSKEVGRDTAKEIMTKHGATALSKVDDCS